MHHSVTYVTQESTVQVEKPRLEVHALLAITALLEHGWLNSFRAQMELIIQSLESLV